MFVQEVGGVRRFTVFLTLTLSCRSVPLVCFLSFAIHHYSNNGLIDAILDGKLVYVLAMNCSYIFLCQSDHFDEVTVVYWIVDFMMASLT